MGLTAISRPPANYLEYIEAEQEHLPANSRQKFTIFSAPLPAPTEITLGLTTTDHGVGGGWKECFEQYPACKQSASTIRPGCSSGWDSPLSKDTRQWSAGRLNQPVVHARLRCGGSEGKGSGREHAAQQWCRTHGTARVRGKRRFERRPHNLRQLQMSRRGTCPS
mmetsp:Transcript_44822/g.132393  ORF Transcript_44822/g.132393 Transcript_44822/m.132393 type:complete len:165 (-) Transcript_44822:322-816(-)